jgi:hypothetical protein
MHEGDGMPPHDPLAEVCTYVWSRCCGYSSHITNSEKPGYDAKMGSQLCDLHSAPRNMYVFIRKLKRQRSTILPKTLGIIPQGSELEGDDYLYVLHSGPVVSGSGSPNFRRVQGSCEQDYRTGLLRTSCL